MSDYLSARTVSLSVPPESNSLFYDLEAGVRSTLAPGEFPIRFTVSESSGYRWCCEIGVEGGGDEARPIFRYIERTHENMGSFNVVMLVPTGIGAEIGGHAGDAAPAATLLSGVCDTLITHPNVLNASDIIHIPENVLYVEGSMITEMLMGASRLIPVRSNRVLVLVQSHQDHMFTDAAVNAVNAARAYYGLIVTEVVTLDSSFRMIGEYNPSGSAVGRVEGAEQIWEILDKRVGTFDAVAISSVIEVPHEYHVHYYDRQGEMVNPWGGVEAMLTHAISLKYRVPAAHSPMFESREVAEIDVGVVDPRMAAEVVSITFLQCILRGMQHSPRIADQDRTNMAGVGVEDVSCLVIPDGCLGLPVLAALQQGIPTVAVKENSNIMQNDLFELPWREGQFIQVENYWEAAGVLASLKGGLNPYSVRRPLDGVRVASAPAEGVTSPLAQFSEFGCSWPPIPTATRNQNAASE